MSDGTYSYTREDLLEAVAAHERIKIQYKARRTKLSPIDRIYLKIGFYGLPTPDREYKFHPTRKWRFDLAWPDQKVAIEFEGGIWTGGAHTRGRHFNSDCEKYNAAAILGWKVLRYTANTVDRVAEDLKTLL